MDQGARIFVAGHRGLVGSAILRCLHASGFENIIVRTHTELDLMDQGAVSRFFDVERPEFVFLAAAKVGGIHANSSYPAEFIYKNLAIQENVIHNSWRSGVKRLLFLGSSCIYPRDCPQPIKEDYLLTGPLESTNRPYAVAKIAGIEMCWAYNRQYGTRYITAMPTNLYGPGDSYDLENSHVLPALIRKMHEAKIRGDTEAVIWGTGSPRREFLYSDDLADACLFLMNLPDHQFSSVLDPNSGKMPPLINIGCGTDLTIRELAELVAKQVGFHRKLVFDPARPDGTPRKILDVSKLTALGWRARTPLETGIQKTYDDWSTK